MIIVLTICSIVFFMFGYFCGRHRKLQEQNPVTRAPIYEDVLPHHRTEELELKSNVAYAKPVIK
jgi:heme/copper-type cytochrome/quinol oxidase subunit 2